MRPQDFLLLQHLEEPTNLTQLAKATGRDISRLSRIVRDLEDLNLVQLEHQGRNLLVHRGGLAANALLKLLDESPHHAWDEILTDTNLELVAFFSSPADARLDAKPTQGVVDRRQRPYVPKTIRDAASWTGQTVDHSRRLINDLAKRAILRKTDDGYLLAPDHTSLREFAKLLHDEWAWKELRAISGDAKPIWQLGRVVLFRTRTPIEGYPHGGFRLAGDHDVAVLADHYTYLMAPWEPTTADAVLQTYLEGPTKTSNVIYACILYAKHRPADLEAKARQYGIPIPAKRIQNYAEMSGSHTGGGFPPAEEYREVARQYGVE